MLATLGHHLDEGGEITNRLKYTRPMVPHGFGLVVVTAMLLFYALEKRNQRFIIAFAGVCAVGSIIGFVRNAWVLGLVESVWCILALRRWWLTPKPL